MGCSARVTSTSSVYAAASTASPWLGGFPGHGDVSYSWELRLGGFPGGLDGLGVVRLASDVFRDVRRGPNMLFDVFNAFQGWGRVIDP